MIKVNNKMSWSLVGLAKFSWEGGLPWKMVYIFRVIALGEMVWLFLCIYLCSLFAESFYLWGDMPISLFLCLDGFWLELVQVKCCHRLSEFMCLSAFRVLKSVTTTGSYNLFMEEDLGGEMGSQIIYNYITIYYNHIIFK